MQVLYKHVRGGGGSEGNAYFAYVVRGGGSRGKMLIVLIVEGGELNPLILDKPTYQILTSF